MNQFENENMEEWKVIEGFEDKYEVSNFGNVRTTIAQQEVSQVLNGYPQYYYVNLTHPDGWRKMERVHRLVAKAFVPNLTPEDRFYVDHIDRDKFNNVASNLRWVTNKENQRNLNNSIFVGDEHLKDYVLRYDNPQAAYSYICRTLSDLGCVEKSINKYEHFLSIGLRKRIVLWEGELVNLNLLCTTHSKDYHKVLHRLDNLGWEIWNALVGIAPTEFHRYSFEVSSSSGVSFWYPSKEYFTCSHKRSVEVLSKLLSLNYSFEEIIAYTGVESEKHIVNGKELTISEHCEEYGITESAVLTRMTRKGLSLEQALLEPRGKVKKLSLNGEYMKPNEMFLKFNIDPKKANRYRSKNKSSFEDTLAHFGVDISGIKISLT